MPMFSAAASPSSTPALTWLGAAFRLWMRAPLRLSAVAFAPVLLEALVQLVPFAGVVASKLAVTLASGWALLVVHAIARSGAAAPLIQVRALVSGGRGVLAVAVLGLAVFAFQLVVCSLVAGPSQAAMLATGQHQAISMSAETLGWIFASGLLPGALLMFVLPYVVLEGRPPLQAIRSSVATAFAYWPAVALFTVLQFAMVAYVPRFPVLLLVLLPFGLCSLYAIYRTVHASPDRVH